MLLHHTAYLMAAPGVQPALASLYQARRAVRRKDGTVSCSTCCVHVCSLCFRPGTEGACAVTCLCCNVACKAKLIRLLSLNLTSVKPSVAINPETHLLNSHRIFR